MVKPEPVRRPDSVSFWTTFLGGACVDRGRAASVCLATLGGHGVGGLQRSKANTTAIDNRGLPQKFNDLMPDAEEKAVTSAVAVWTCSGRVQQVKSTNVS